MKLIFTRTEYDKGPAHAVDTVMTVLEGAQLIGQHKHPPCSTVWLETPSGFRIPVFWKAYRSRMCLNSAAGSALVMLSISKWGEGGMTFQVDEVISMETCIGRI